MGLHIYRELTNPADDLRAWLELRDQLYSVTDDKGDVHLFVDNDAPRDADINEEIVNSATAGFSLFTDEGKRIAGFADLASANEAMASARIVVTAQVEGVDPDSQWG